MLSQVEGEGSSLLSLVRLVSTLIRGSGRGKVGEHCEDVKVRIGCSH